MSTMNKNKEKIYERNPSTDTIRWRYVGEKVDLSKTSLSSSTPMYWPNYGRILRERKKKKNTNNIK